LLVPVCSDVVVAVTMMSALIHSTSAAAIFLLSRADKFADGGWMLQK
jgi:hypothetical protein